MARSELYQFKHGDKQWYFTSARKAIIHDGITYYPVRGLSRGSIEDADIDKAEIEITLPQPYSLLNKDEQSLSQIFVNKIFYQGVKVEIFELEEDTKLFVFRGRVVKPSFDENDDTMTLSCATAETQFRRTIFTQKFQRTCPYSIYDLFCGLDINEWSFEARITSISGTAFTFEVLPTQVEDEEGEPVFDEVDDPVMEVKSYPYGYLSNGLLIKDGVYTWLRDDNTMYRPHFGLTVDDIVKLAPGCDQSRVMCHERFNNHKRYGGHINIPSENPVETQIIK